mgnify:FL=1
MSVKLRPKKHRQPPPVKRQPPRREPSQAHDGRPTAEPDLEPCSLGCHPRKRILVRFESPEAILTEVDEWPEWKRGARDRG